MLRGRVETFGHHCTVPHAAVVPGGVLCRLVLASLLDVGSEDVLSPLLPHLQHYVQLVQNLHRQSTRVMNALPPYWLMCHIGNCLSMP